MHTDDIGVASALARLTRSAPQIPPRLEKDERERRLTQTRKRHLLSELTSLRTELGLADLLLTERDYRIDDRKSIIEWCVLENEGEVMWDGTDVDGEPDLIDLTEYRPVLRNTGFWDEHAVYE